MSLGLLFHYLHYAGMSAAFENQLIKLSEIENYVGVTNEINITENN